MARLGTADAVGPDPELATAAHQHPAIGVAPEFELAQPSTLTAVCPVNVCQRSMATWV
jgi:hypothetical protein